MEDWSREPVSSLKGVGPKLADKLARLGIRDKQQMLFHLPLRYEDRTRVTPIAALQPGRGAVFEGEVLQSGVRFRSGGRSRRVLLVKLADRSGILTLRFFHFNAAQQNLLEKGAWIRGYGEPRFIAGSPEIAHPEFQRIDPQHPPPLPSELTPVYPVTEGLHQLGLRKLMAQLLDELAHRGLAETLPEDWLRRQQLPPVAEALRVLHHPRDRSEVKQIQAMRHPAQRRFIVEELAAHRVTLLQRRAEHARQRAPTICDVGKLQQAFIKQLPFQLTAAQKRVVEELMADYRSGRPMLRLVQGDVGSGKTVVAALAALPVIDSGFQVALMAPTEILAEQHARNFAEWLQPLGIEVLMLSGSDKGRRRQHKEGLIESGQARMIVGTHALFQQSVAFQALGMVIIDEQHRFGVAQRQALRDKAPQGLVPHQLVMTATPIPRTLAMSVYADLDYAQIDELPPGRSSVITSILPAAQRPALIQRVRAACAEGKQLYWVCTLIEESEALQAEAAEDSYEHLRREMPELRIGLVHGRMKPAEKEAVVQAFKARELDLLVATTVIEVGVDVPNASIMIIENPERLGLSQIHQLRGRVGRGSEQSYCLLLLGDQPSRSVRERLEIIREHQDGFVIAEKDLELRGAGEVLGTRQTGEAGFRIADLLRDRELFPLAAELAERMMQPQQAERCQRLIDNWIGDRARFSDVA